MRSCSGALRNSKVAPSPGQDCMPQSKHAFSQEERIGCSMRLGAYGLERLCQSGPVRWLASCVFSLNYRPGTGRFTTSASHHLTRRAAKPSSRTKVPVPMWHFKAACLPSSLLTCRRRHTKSPRGFTKVPVYNFGNHRKQSK